MTRTWVITWSALRSGSTTWGRRDGIPLRARKTLVNTASLLFNKCLYTPKSTFFYISLPKRKTMFHASPINGTKEHKEMKIQKKFLTNNRHYYWCIMWICNVDKKWKDVVSNGEWVHNAQQMFYTGQYYKLYLKKKPTQFSVINCIQIFWKAMNNISALTRTCKYKERS